MTGPAQGGVVITAADQYQEMKVISAGVTHLTAKLDDHNRRLEEHAKDLGDHENRLRNLEYKTWAAIGIFGIVCAVAASLIAHFLTAR